MGRAGQGAAGLGMPLSVLSSAHDTLLENEEGRASGQPPVGNSQEGGRRGSRRLSPCLPHLVHVGQPSDPARGPAATSI